MTTSLAAGVLVAGVGSAALSPLVLAALRHRAVIDVPNERSSHAAPTPRGLGLAPAIGITVAALVLLEGDTRTAFVSAGCLFGALGLIEDLRGIKALTRLAAQAAIAGAVSPWLLVGMTGSAAWKAAFATGCVVWLVAFVNGFNFMDGVNGISAAQAVVAGVAWYAVGRIEDVSFLADIGAITAAGAVGFAPLNFPVARAFIGDVGSYFFGGILGVTAVLSLRAGVPFEAVFGPLFLYLTDTAVTIVRRVRRGEKWHEPHRSHVYQRLHQLGLSHAATTGTVAAAMTVTSLGGLMAVTDSVAARVVGVAAMVIVLALYMASPDVLQARRGGAERAA